MVEPLVESKTKDYVPFQALVDGMKDSQAVSGLQSTQESVGLVAGRPSQTVVELKSQDENREKNKTPEIQPVPVDEENASAHVSTRAEGNLAISRTQSLGDLQSDQPSRGEPCDSKRRSRWGFDAQSTAQQELYDTMSPDLCVSGGHGKMKWISDTVDIDHNVRETRYDYLRGRLLANDPGPLSTCSTSRRISPSLRSGGSSPSLPLPSVGSERSVSSSSLPLRSSEGPGTLHSVPSLRFAYSTPLPGLNKPRVVCIDYRDSISCADYLGVDIIDSRESSWIEFKDQIRNAAPAEDAYLRLIIAEDLDENVVSLLGSLFWLSPRVFNRHASSTTMSNPRGPSNLPSTVISECQLSSLTWHRPVWRSSSMLAGMTLTDRANLTSKGQAEWGETRTSPSGRVRKQLSREALAKSFIFRSEQAFPEHGRSEVEGVGKWIAAAWEERMTVYVSQRKNCKIVLLLTDPLPKIRLSTTHVQTIYLAGNRIGTPDQRPYVEDLLLIAQQVSRVVKSGAGDATMIAEESEGIGAPRSTVSLLESLLEWSKMPSTHLHRPDPRHALLRFLQVDLTRHIENIQSTLVMIEHESIVEHILKESLYQWREWIKQVRINIPQTRLHLQDFAHTLYRDTTSYDERGYRHQKSLPQEVDRLVHIMIAKLQAIEDKCEKTESTLRAEVSLLDSRRSIAEAESVSKLTELAFVFVPLSFAASLFSIQIRELQNGVPLSSFVVACIVVLSVAYVARFSAESTLLHRLKTTCIDDAYNFSRVQKTNSLSTLQILSWALHRLSHSIAFVLKKLTLLLKLYAFSPQSLLLLSFTCILFIPVILLWTSPAVGGIKAIYGAVYVVLALTFAAVCAMSLFTVEEGRLRWESGIFEGWAQADWGRDANVDEEEDGDVEGWDLDVGGGGRWIGRM